jgi:hypothetical protein
LNEQPIAARAAVMAGDIITVGRVKLKVELE